MILFFVYIVLDNIDSLEQCVYVCVLGNCLVKLHSMFSSRYDDGKWSIDTINTTISLTYFNIKMQNTLKLKKKNVWFV